MLTAPVRPALAGGRDICNNKRMLPYNALPHLNALLNGLSAILLLTGYSCIRRKNKQAHRAFMLSAAAASMLFLVSYLTYHTHSGLIRFQGQGWVRPVYFSILTTHTILAATVLPLAATTLVFAFGGKFHRHRRIALWTFPIWLYVSVTGVLVYVMLYRW